MRVICDDEHDYQHEQRLFGLFNSSLCAVSSSRFQLLFWLDFFSVLQWTLQQPWTLPFPRLGLQLIFGFFQFFFLGTTFSSRCCHWRLSGALSRFWKELRELWATSTKLLSFYNLISWRILPQKHLNSSIDCPTRPKVPVYAFCSQSMVTFIRCFGQKLLREYIIEMNS